MERAQGEGTWICSHDHEADCDGAFEFGVEGCLLEQGDEWCSPRQFVVGNLKDRTASEEHSLAGMDADDVTGRADHSKRVDRSEGRGGLSFSTREIG